MREELRICQMCGCEFQDHNLACPTDPFTLEGLQQELKETQTLYLKAVRAHEEQKLHIRAEMARRGLTWGQLVPYWSPDTDSQINPLDDPEVHSTIRQFVKWLWVEMS